MQEIDIGYTVGLPFKDEDGQWRIKVAMQEDIKTGEFFDIIEACLSLPYGVLQAPPENTPVFMFFINNTNCFALPIDDDEYMAQLQKNGMRVGNLKDNIYLDFTPEKILLMHKAINILDNLNERDIDIKGGLTSARQALDVIKTAFTSMQNASGGTSVEVQLIKAAAGIAASQLTAFINGIQTAENNIQAKYDLIDNLIS